MLPTFKRIKRAIKRKKCPLNRAEPIYPLFVVGSGRSGTTLVRRILLASRQIHIPPEAKFLGDSIEVFKTVQRYPWNRIVREVLAIWEFNTSFQYWNICLASTAYKLYETGNKSRSMAVILDAVYQLHMSTYGDGLTRWGDKTPAHTAHMENILSVFPNAKFVNMVRDAADVVDSFKRAGFLGGKPERAAQRWVEAVEASHAFTARHPDRIMTVRYEDLVRAPEEHASKICAFGDLRFDPAMLEDLSPSSAIIHSNNASHHAKLLQPISSKFIGAGREALDADTRQMVAKLANPMMQLYGYEPI